MQTPDRPDTPPVRRPRKRAPSSAPVRLPPFASESFDPWADSFPEDAAHDARPYRVRSEEVWQEARRFYILGDSAEAVCERYDLGLSAFRQRARREGWRKRDLEDAQPNPADAAPTGFPPEPEPAPPTPDMVDLAWRSAAQAIRRGRVYEARAWMRLWEALRTVARRESDAAHVAERMAERQAEREVEAEAAQAAADAEVHALHGDDAVQSGPPSRAECQILLKGLEAEAARGGHIPMFASALMEVHGALAMAAQKRPLGP